MTFLHPAELGYAVRQKLADWGFGARLLGQLALMSGPCLKRFGLVRDQVHFLGNYSLAIITVSGLFVGFVLGHPICCRTGDSREVLATATASLLGRVTTSPRMQLHAHRLSQRPSPEQTSATD